MSRPRLLIVLLSTCSLLVLCWASARAFQARPLAQRTYSWIAELVATDTAAKTITVKARIPEYIAKYTDRFKPGDHITLIWNMLPPPVPPSAAASEKDTAKPSAAGGTPGPAAPAAPPTVVLKTESDLVMSIDSSDATKRTKLDTGFILPAEFVSAEAKTVTIKLHVADTTLRSVASMRPGTWLRATSPMNQPTEVAAIAAVTTTSPPPVGADTK
jgi:hypothetical protein